MKMPLETIPVAYDSIRSWIFRMMPVPLSHVPFHNNTPAENFPVHIAVHDVSTVIKTPTEYAQPHAHSDCDEINIILSQSNLVYKTQLDDEEYIVTAIPVYGFLAAHYIRPMYSKVQDILLP